MAYRIHVDDPLGANVRRVLGQQIDRARRDLMGADRVEAVHAFRKRCKKIRALLRLVRPALGKQFRIENERFRDMARRVAAVRDADVMVETFDTLLETCEPDIDRRHYAPLRPQLAERSGRDADPALTGIASELDAELSEARAALPTYRFSAEGFDAIGEGLARTYGRARTDMKQARRQLTAPAFHEWRKRVKYHRHHCDLLRDLWPGPMKARASELQRLAELLGDEHDLAVLAQYVMAGRAGDPERRSETALLSLIERRRTELQQAALPLGRRLFAEDADAFRKRLKQYWKARRLELEH